MIVKGYFKFFGDKAIHISKKIRIFAENFSADRKQRHFITPCRDWLYRSVFRNRTSLLAYCHREVRMPKLTEARGESRLLELSRAKGRSPKGKPRVEAAGREPVYRAERLMNT